MDLKKPKRVFHFAELEFRRLRKIELLRIKEKFIQLRSATG